MNGRMAIVSLNRDVAESGVRWGGHSVRALGIDSLKLV